MPSRLKKHQTLDILLMTDFFYEFSKIDDFTKSSASYTKFILCVLFYVNLFDTPCNLMSLFSNDIFFTNLVSTSAFNMKF